MFRNKGRWTLRRIASKQATTRFGRRQAGLKSRTRKNRRRCEVCVFSYVDGLVVGRLSIDRIQVKDKCK